MKKFVLIVLVVAVIALFTTGCFKHTFDVGKGATSGQTVYSKWHSHWLFGIIGDDTVDVKKLCPSGNATIHNEISFVNGLIGAFVGIVYYPTTVTIKCRSGKKAEVELNAEEAAALITDPNFIYIVDEVAPGMRDQAELAITNAENFMTAQSLYAMK
ncbi:MAG: hypothetical protein P9L99_09850 [Candidatus Lernaella stagnicola]|nr:hypothetical protein [Candidatus Lernaella stagnicola]